MKKNDLLKFNDGIIRVLDIRDDKVLLIYCHNCSMPQWAEQSTLAEYRPCEESTLHEATGMIPPCMDTLSSADKRIAHERYTLIAGILPFIGDSKLRSNVIGRIAADKHVSKQTLRKYLRLFLIFQKMAALAPKQKPVDTQMTLDEKNMRWALNKFFYTRRKNSLHTAYTLMLKEKYCDGSGNLSPVYPTFYQFRYFYRKHRNMETFFISRDGLKSYQRNNRPLLGDGVQEYAPAVGVGMLDSTVCDIYLVNDAGSLVGRPILTACVDAYSGLCCGYSLTWEGGVYSIRNLMCNIIADKVLWSRQFGISLHPEEWPCHQLPGTMITDMGAEYKSDNFEQIAELGVTIVNLPSYRPELKGVVEKFFDLIQESYKKHLHGKGVIEPDYQERGAHDYRKDACLTMVDFEKILLHSIIYYNSKRIISDYPYTEAMIAQKVSPNSSAIWNWGISDLGVNLIDVDHDTLMLTLLPRTIGRFSRKGLTVNKLRYRHDEYKERYLQGGKAVVAYNPHDISAVWLVENGSYIRFELIESRFQGKELAEVQSIKAEQRELEIASTDVNLQAQIDLANHIDAIANSAIRHRETNIKDIRRTRKTEQARAHMDLLKGGAKK